MYIKKLNCADFILFENPLSAEMSLNILLCWRYFNARAETVNVSNILTVKIEFPNKVLKEIGDVFYEKLPGNI